MFMVLQWFYPVTRQNNFVGGTCVPPSALLVLYGRYAQWNYWRSVFFCRAMLCVSAAYAVVRCPSVCLSVTFMYSVDMNKYIVKLFSLSGRSTILVFPYEVLWQLFDRDPLSGALNAAGRVWKNRCFLTVCRFIACCQRCNRQVL